MIPPRKPIQRASFEDIIRNGAVGNLQQVQLREHVKRRKTFLQGIAPGIDAARLEQHLAAAMEAEGIDEAGLWRALANGHVPEQKLLRDRLERRIRFRISPSPSPLNGPAGANGGARRRKGKGAKKKSGSKAWVHQAQGQTRKAGSRRNQA